MGRAAGGGQGQGSDTPPHVTRNPSGVRGVLLGYSRHGTNTEACDTNTAALTGCRSRYSATTPVTWGVAMDVPVLFCQGRERRTAES